MPRTVAAMLGVALVAFSIGFNTVRYPIVWEMVNATEPSGRAEPSDMAAASQGSAVTSTMPLPAPVDPPKPIETAAPPQVVGEAAAGGTQELYAGNDEGVPVQREAQKALVPVVPVALSMTASDNAAGVGIRRLPPVTQGYANPANVAQSLGGSIPIYPTTGIE